jgi:transcriptional regulator with XRE-family HTH domain
MSDESAPTVSESFRRGLREAREYRGLRQQDLVDLLEHDHAVKMDRATLTRMESGDRKVSLEEAVLLAVALDVPLPLLLLPVDQEAEVALTPTVSAHPWRVWEWLHGQEPLPTSELHRWRPVVQSAWLYSDVRDAQKDAQDKRVTLRIATKSGADEAGMRAARQGYADALRGLREALKSMERAGLPTRGLLAEEFRAEMFEFGVLEESDQ